MKGNDPHFKSYREVRIVIIDGKHEEVERPNDRIVRITETEAKMMNDQKLNRLFVYKLVVEKKAAEKELSEMNRGELDKHIIDNNLPLVTDDYKNIALLLKAIENLK